VPKKRRCNTLTPRKSLPLHTRIFCPVRYENRKHRLNFGGRTTRWLFSTQSCDRHFPGWSGNSNFKGTWLLDHFKYRSNAQRLHVADSRASILKLSVYLALHSRHVVWDHGKESEVVALDMWSLLDSNSETIFKV